MTVKLLVITELVCLEVIDVMDTMTVETIVMKKDVVQVYTMYMFRWSTYMHR